MEISKKIALAAAITFAVSNIGGAAMAANAASSVKQSADGGDDDNKPVKAAAKNKTFSGNVSWYGPGFDGRLTASGERFNMMKLTAAHLKLKFNTKVLVEDPRTGNTVIVRVNDRGPYHAKRVMDLSKGGAMKLGTISRGVTYVDCMILDEDKKS
ncbi:MAG: septal ring lytic transglycosylase RlpA family protein [Candidatus Melainabacteria bacterium]|jgi:rare lipoprotein A|nr:septal ring lytic transglycosylase RlpA family protein [Candidatus Melainabacteria bacterium]